jgi:hypothetical protein
MQFALKKAKVKEERFTVENTVENTKSITIENNGNAHK